MTNDLTSENAQTARFEDKIAEQRSINTAIMKPIPESLFPELQI